MHSGWTHGADLYSLCTSQYRYKEAIIIIIIAHSANRTRSHARTETHTLNENAAKTDGGRVWCAARRAHASDVRWPCSNSTLTAQSIRVYRVWSIERVVDFRYKVLRLCVPQSCKMHNAPNAVSKIYVERRICGQTCGTILRKCFHNKVPSRAPRDVCLALVFN